MERKHFEECREIIDFHIYSDSVKYIVIQHNETIHLQLFYH